MNPLLHPYTTVFETVPFEEVKNQHFLPALKEAIKKSKEEIEAIINTQETPDFKNTIEKLERSGELVDKVTGIFFNLNSAETNDEIQKIAHEFSPRLTEYRNDIMLNEKLFYRIKEGRDQTNDKLNEEQQMLLEKTYRSFVQNGAMLKGDAKNKLREIDDKLARLSLQFGENILTETNGFELVIDRKEDLKGLPVDVVEAAAETAEGKGQKGKHIFTLHYPSYTPFITYAQNRELREKMMKAYGSRAFKDNKHNNEQLVKKMINLRQQRAELLGFKNHAEYSIQERMAETPQKVESFLQELLQIAKPAAREEIEDIKKFAWSKDGIEEFQKWDLAYYGEKMKQQKFQIDDEILKPYFSLQNVIQGAFEAANKLYAISFYERDDIQKYHRDVVTYEVRDEKENHLAVFYADFYPREGKQSGAWMTSYRSQKIINGENKRPHISIVCNFTKPTKTKPSLLTFREVLTFFHEFGHNLHGTLANSTYASLSGTNVYWDFVELPSQIMENWCYQKKCLDLFARHYENGELIPIELVEKLRKSATFMEGYATLRQVGLAKLDMTWHTANLTKINSVSEYEEEVLKETEILPWVAGSNTSCGFAHIFQGGYSAGYYSYKWAEVLDADAFEYFLEKGIFNRKIAGKFKKLLSAGGSRHPMELYKEFRGNEPDIKALLRRAGLDL